MSSAKLERSSLISRREQRRFASNHKSAVGRTRRELAREQALTEAMDSTLRAGRSAAPAQGTLLLYERAPDPARIVEQVATLVAPKPEVDDAAGSSDDGNARDRVVRLGPHFKLPDIAAPHVPTQAQLANPPAVWKPPATEASSPLVSTSPFFKSPFGHAPVSVPKHNRLSLIKKPRVLPSLARSRPTSRSQSRPRSRAAVRAKPKPVEPTPPATPEPADGAAAALPTVAETPSPVQIRPSVQASPQAATPPVNPVTKTPAPTPARHVSPTVPAAPSPAPSSAPASAPTRTAEAGSPHPSTATATVAASTTPVFVPRIRADASMWLQLGGRLVPGLDGLPVRLANAGRCDGGHLLLKATMFSRGVELELFERSSRAKAVHELPWHTVLWLTPKRKPLTMLQALCKHIAFPSRSSGDKFVLELTKLVDPGCRANIVLANVGIAKAVFRGAGVSRYLLDAHVEVEVGHSGQVNPPHLMIRGMRVPIPVTVRGSRPLPLSPPSDVRAALARVVAAVTVDATTNTAVIPRLDCLLREREP